MADRVFSFFSGLEYLCKHREAHLLCYLEGELKYIYRIKDNRIQFSLYHGTNYDWHFLNDYMNPGYLAGAYVYKVAVLSQPEPKYEFLQE